MQLATDMQRFSRPERRINGPTISHLWCVIMLILLFLSLLFIYLFNSFILDSRSMLKLFDVLVQLDHLKNAKASIPNDFSWYKRYAFSFCLCYFIFMQRIFNFTFRFCLLCLSFVPSLNPFILMPLLGVCCLTCKLMSRDFLHLSMLFLNVTSVVHSIQCFVDWNTYFKLRHFRDLTFCLT